MSVDFWPIGRAEKAHRGGISRMKMAVAEDLNPRWGLPHTRFRACSLGQLGHATGEKLTGRQRAAQIARARRPRGGPNHAARGRNLPSSAAHSSARTPSPGFRPMCQAPILRATSHSDRRHPFWAPMPDTTRATLAMTVRRRTWCRVRRVTRDGACLRAATPVAGGCCGPS